MLGLVVTLAFSIAAMGLGYLLFRRFLLDFDRRARMGLSGLLGLGVVGMLTLFLGSLPGGLRWGAGVVGALGVVGLLALWKYREELWQFRRPVGLELLGLIVPLLLGLVPLVGVLVPSSATDWDSIAYHLAVPKMWLQAGQITEVSFIHHSNFPFTVDNLFVWGLAWGGQEGAKAFMLVFYLLGLLTLFGLARWTYGVAAGFWACLVFASVPAVLWESGTAYIDVAHGLYAAVGAWLVLGPERRRDGHALIGGLLLGLAAGSKYTGLQTLIVVGLVAVFLAIRERPLAKGIGIAAALSALVAAPWYVKNAVQLGNPVYPFFYERFGGKNWNQTQADVYRNEQKTFGVPFDGPLSVPHAILGLAHSPGRFTNPGQKLQQTPQGPVGATGSPTASLGFVVIAGFLVALAFARPLRAGPVLAYLLLSLLLWTVLSQQSRYGLSFAPLVALLVGGIVGQGSLAGRVLALATVAQTVLTLWVCQQLLLVKPRLDVVLGSLPAENYKLRFVSFYPAAKVINETEEIKKIALYDEVFGFYLDKPYYWASYGHSTELGYETMKTADDLVAAYRRLGITHAYVNLAFQDPNFVEMSWLPAMGFMGQPAPMAPAEREALFNDVQSRWKPLFAEAVAAGKMTLIHREGRGLIFRVEPK